MKYTEKEQKMTQTPEEASELEKVLCCICNGKGIQYGENAMCPKHYQSEVINKKTDDTHPMSIEIHWLDKESLFVIKFMEGQESIFTVTLNPTNFEKMTNDMIKTIKNYNLWQLNEYKEKQKQLEEGAIQKSVPYLYSSDKSSEAQPEQSESNN